MRLTFVNAVKYHLFTLYYNLTSRSDVPTDARRYGKDSMPLRNSHSWQSISYRFDAVTLTAQQEDFATVAFFCNFVPKSFRFISR